MTRFEDNLWSDLVREHGARLMQSARPTPGLARVLRHPRVLASGTLGLAAAGATLMLALGGSAAAPAFAITLHRDGSVLVKLNRRASRNIVAINAKLAALGLHEAVTIHLAPGAARSPGAVSCTRTLGGQTPVTVLVGVNGTETIEHRFAGKVTTATYHLNHCMVTRASRSAATGQQAATARRSVAESSR